MQRVAVLLLLLAAAPALFAEDAPTFRVGALLFADYTWTQSPERLDANGDLIHPSAFTVQRAYINVTGTVNKYLSWRITPDIARESGTTSSLSGSQEYRLKFAWAQLNLEEWSTPGSFVRFGVVTTPMIDYTEQIYRYRFQGAVFLDREGFQSASDAGVTARYALRGDYGDVMGGIYNGETYARSEQNDQKSMQLRVSIRPLPKHPLLKGWRVTGFVNDDRYVGSAPRRRLVAQTTFEHPHVVAGLDVLRATDQVSRTAPEIDAHGYSLWVTPRFVRGWEALLRYDRLRRENLLSQRRDIEGVAYWFRMPKGVATALLLDRDSLAVSGAPKLTNYGLKMLLSF
ncbi:MAG TPA: hypothetical protein VGR02_14445 [Thermoanaerobaculia bacterium]|jgi:hypothetical protein|nr:hypothetical protein [Thermoanaerobaculia bacterium]